jgi:hypothetical protein
MSVTGSIYRTSEVEIEDYKKSPNWNPKFKHESLFLDSFFYDLFEILTKYSDLKKEDVVPIIEGSIIIRKDESHIGYSTAENVVKLDLTLSLIDNLKFKTYFDRALNDPQSYVYHFKGNQVYIEGIMNYFDRLKKYYKDAAVSLDYLLHIIA